MWCHPRSYLRVLRPPSGYGPEGFLFLGLMNRITFLVDGFNVYHSAKEASSDLGGVSTLWLDLSALLTAYVSSTFGRDAVLSEIFYFSALATHMDRRRPGTTTRHRAYIECLRSTGVRVQLGRFKYKTVWCSGCRTDNVHYEEKETDVALSTKLLELFHLDDCDTAVLVTGDTDLLPTVRTASRLFGTKEVCFAFPYHRKNKELAAAVTQHFLIRKERYAANQFPDPVVLPNGRTIPKPAGW
jgi:uncharacterized LabA/DUF88 family protein